VGEGNQEKGDAERKNGKNLSSNKKGVKKAGAKKLKELIWSQTRNQKDGDTYQEAPRAPGA